MEYSPFYIIIKLMKWHPTGMMRRVESYDLRKRIVISLIFALFLLFLTSSPLFSQSKETINSTIDPALEKDKYFYIEGGYANWEPSAVKTHLRLSESSNFNGVPANASLGKKDRVNSFEFSSAARFVSLGIALPSQSGFQRGKFLLSYLSSGFGYLDNFFYRSTNFNYISNYINTQETGISQYSLGTVKRYTAQYDHDFYFLPDHPSKYLVGMGIKIGVNLEYDTFSPSYRSLSLIQNTVSISPTQVSQSGNSPLLRNSEMYDEVSGSGILGFTYRLATLPNQELELNSLYYSGYGRVYQTSTFNQFISVGSELFPIRITDDTKGRTEVEGKSFYFSYLFKITEMRNIKFFIMDKSMNHRVVKLDTISTPESFPTFEGFGPYPDVTDRLRSIGIQFQIKY